MLSALLRAVLATVIVLSNTLLCAEEPPPISFRRDVAPVLRDHCLACHSDRKAEGNYRVDTFAQLRKPGDSEEPPLVAGQPDASELLRRLKSDDESERMPLEAPPLAAETVAKFEQWIQAGAVYDGEDPRQPIVTIVPPPAYPAPPASYRVAVPVTAMTRFAAEGVEYLATSGHGELLIWKLADGSLENRIRNLPPRIHSIAVIAEPTRFVVAGGDPGRVGDVRIVDVSGSRLETTPLVRGDVVLSIDHTSNGESIAAASSDGSVSLIKSNEFVWSKEIHKDWATAVRFSADGKRLVSAGLDQQAKLLDANSGQEEVTFSGHKFPIWSVAFAGDGQSVFTGDEGGRVLQWSTSDAKQLAELRTSGAVYEIALHDGKLYAAVAGSRVTEFDIASKKAVRHFTGLSGQAIAVELNPDEEELVAGTDRGDIVVFSLTTGKVVRKWKNQVPGKPTKQ